MNLVPHVIKQAINRASLPVSGVPVAMFSTAFTEEMVNEGIIDEGREAIEEAGEAFTHMDREIFGPGEKWAPWFDFIDNGRGLVTHTYDYESEKNRGLIRVNVRRERVLLAIPKARWRNHLAVTFLRVNFYGDLWR